jgi:PIN like domain
VRRRRLREPFVYFVDECLGRHIVPKALRGSIDDGERVETRPPGTLDLDWIPAANAGGWVCLTKDRALRRRPNELSALLSGAFAVFLIGEARGEVHAERLVRALPVMRRALRSRDVPLIARIEDDGGITILYEDGKRLEPPRRLKLKARDR